MAMAARPALALLLLALLLPAQTRSEPEATVPVQIPTPALTSIQRGNSSVSRLLPRIELRGRGRRPEPRRLVLLVPLALLALRPILG